MMQRSTKSGITLLELMVAISIITILLGLLLPAVQSARASARALQCQNNLRQVALATLQFHDTKHRFPFGGTMRELLPFMEQQALQDALGPYGSEAKIPLQSPSVVLCPERRPLDTYAMYVNYCMNNGGTTIPRSGLFGGDQLGRLREITDGLSNTMMLSERLSTPFNEPIQPGSPLGHTHKRRVRWHCDKFFGKNQEAQFLQYVTSTTPTQFEYLQPGVLTGVSLYDHLAPPNRLAFLNGPDSTPAVGMTPATSNHQGGVYAGRCDGSVGFISDDIDAKVWRVLGTVNRQDIVQEF